MTVPCIKQWFATAIPVPTDANRCVQLGVHFEEVAEMVESFGGETDLQSELESMAAEMKAAPATLGEEAFAQSWAAGAASIDRKALLDSLCDQIVTAIGVAHMFDFNIEDALAEVNRSNWSKFVDGKPVFDTNGKIAKPASYSPPDLSRYL